MGVLCFKGSHVWENVIKYLGWKLSTAMLYIIHQVRLLTALQINLLKNSIMKKWNPKKVDFSPLYRRIEAHRKSIESLKKIEQ